MHPEPWACMKLPRPATVAGARARGVGGNPYTLALAKEGEAPTP